jgi:hypothetical protein
MVIVLVLRLSDPCESQELTIRGVRVSPETPSVGELVTLHLDMQGTWRTPFWQEEVSLDADLVAPDGTTWRIPGFYTADCELVASNDGRSAPKVIGQPEWQVRLMPEMAGEHHITLLARDRSGRTVQEKLAVEVAPGMRRPFIRVSRTDPHYFEFDDGKPYFANGENICWYSAEAGVPQYDRWFGRLAENGGNFARVHLCRWAFGYEWGKAGHYRLDRAWEVDYVLRLAEEKGIYIKLCGEWFRELEDDNPYRNDNGGPCESIRDVFTDDEAKRMWRNRLRYAVARWGYSPNIMAWELWDEIDCINEYERETVQGWEQEMSQYLRSIDPHNHLVVSSLGSFAIEPGLWAMPEIGFAQFHGYHHPSWYSNEFGRDMAELLTRPMPLLRRFGKPVLIGEFGLVDEGWWEGEMAKSDPEGVSFHNGMWAAIMAGCAGPAHMWGWEVYVDAFDLWWHHLPIARFAADVPWTAEQFVPFEAWTSSTDVRALGLQGISQTLLWIQNNAHTWWNVNRKQPIPAQKDVRVYFPIPPGDYLIERWDTYTGETIATYRTGEVMGALRANACRDGLILQIGDIETDAAIKVIRQPSGNSSFAPTQ